MQSTPTLTIAYRYSLGERADAGIAAFQRAFPISSECPVGFALGYVIAGEGRSNPHGGLILVALLMFGGAILGLSMGAVAAYRVGQRVT